MNVFSLWLTHAVALTLKETRQILRDKSAILLGVFMPLMLIILFGYGLSFDVRNIRLGVVDTVRTEQTERITASLVANESFKTTVYVARSDALKALESFEIEALAVFEKQNTSSVSRQIVVDGIDAPRATYPNKMTYKTKGPTRIMRLVRSLSVVRSSLCISARNRALR